MARIGVFDSGVGGLTVLKEMYQRAPWHTFVYFGDTARCPYGNKSQETVVRYSLENSAFLISQGIDYLVVACNTATALALDELQKQCSVPVIGVVEPAAMEASARTRNGRIGVIGTRSTIHSFVYQRALQQLKDDICVYTQACPLFVPLVEEKYKTRAVIQEIVKEYLAPLKQQRVDTLLLGCTHYPLLFEYIRQEMGDEVAIIDPACACASLVKNISEDHKSEQTVSQRFQFFVSDDPSRFLTTARDFFGDTLQDLPCIAVVQDEVSTAS